MSNVTDLLDEYKEYLEKHSRIKHKQRHLDYFKHWLATCDLKVISKDEIKQYLTTHPYNDSLKHVYKWLDIASRPKPKLSKVNRPPQKIRQKENSPHPRDDSYLKRMVEERGIQKSTTVGYYSTLIAYWNVTGFTSVKEMIDEAYEDEQKRIPVKQTRLKKHLADYQVYLNKQNITDHTRHSYFTKIETLYRHFDVTIPNRPPMKIKNDYHVDYYDLPDKEMIKTAITQVPLAFKSMILFMSSSGTAKAETLNLTVGRFIDGLRDYTASSDPQKVVGMLRKRRDLVPLIKMMRIKTKVPYFTCCSPEATEAILEYLYKEKNYQRDSKVWDYAGSYVMKIFQTINDSNNWGRIGPYRRFRCHMLRKYHASNLGCDFTIINTLEGRTNNTIYETYVKMNPDALKEVYMQHMHNVMINVENYIGTKLGGESENEKIKKNIKEVVPDLEAISNENKSLMEDMKQEFKSMVMDMQEALQPPPAQVPAPVEFTTASTPAPAVDTSVLIEIGKLTQRLDTLENKLNELEKRI